MSVKKDFDISQWQSRPIRIVKICEKILFFQEVEVKSLELRQYFPRLEDSRRRHMSIHCLHTNQSWVSRNEVYRIAL